MNFAPRARKFASHILPQTFVCLHNCAHMHCDVDLRSRRMWAASYRLTRLVMNESSELLESFCTGHARVRAERGGDGGDGAVADAPGLDQYPSDMRGAQIFVVYGTITNANIYYSSFGVVLQESTRMLYGSCNYQVRIFWREQLQHLCTLCYSLFTLSTEDKNIDEKWIYFARRNASKPVLSDG